MTGLPASFGPLTRALGLAVSPDAENALARLYEVMTADPLLSSLTKILAPEEIAARHLLDSLAPLALDLPFWKTARTILDIGTGAGFPAFPLAAALPETTVHALDSKGKAVEFVRRVAFGAGIPNITGILGRAEELARNQRFRESYDLVVCRALASVRVLAELCSPFARTGGFILLYKGPNLDNEMGEADRAFKLLRIGPDQISRLTLAPPRLPFERGFVVIRKHSPTPDRYPRRNGIPASNPL